MFNPIPSSLFERNEYESARLHAGDLSEIQSLTQSFDRELMSVRPYMDSDGLEHAENLVSVFHDPSVNWSWMRKQLGLLERPNTYSFEMWFSDGKLRFQLSTPNKDKQSEVRKQIGGLYPNAAVEESDRLLPVIPDSGYLVGGELNLSETVYAPLRSFSGPDNFDIQGEDMKRRGVEDTIDPYKSITSELTGHDSEAVMVQIIFRAAPEEWTEGRHVGQPSSDLVVRGLQQGMFVDSWINPRIEEAKEKSKNTAEYIGDVEGKQAFDAEIRYFVIDPDRENAIRHAKQIENIYHSVYKNDAVNQQFVANRFGSDEARDMLMKAGRREMSDNCFPITKGELAALAHLPNDEIDTPKINWVNSAFGNEIPGDTNKKSKDHLIDEEANSNEYDYAEEAEYPSSQHPTTDADLFETAKQVVSRSDDVYYRDDVDADEYPHTEVVEENVPPEKRETFLEYCAAYESGDIDESDIAADFETEKQMEKMVALIEDHIEASYLIWAESESDSAEGTEYDSDYGFANAPQLTDGRSSNEPLPDTVSDQTNEAGVDEAATATSGSVSPSVGDSRGSRQEDKLPATQGKYAVQLDSSEVRATRTESGKITNMLFKSKDSDGHPYMGKDVRELFIEAHDSIDNRDEDVWLGYQETANNPTREIGWDSGSWMRHKVMFGNSGMGKSTLMLNEMNQVARKGYGFVMIDPKGDIAKDILRTLPEDRLDDVVWVEPGDYEHDKVTAINFLQTIVPKGDPRYDRAVESTIDDIQKILKAGRYWGPKMAGITKNISRAMIRSSSPYTLYDMYNVLMDSESREQFTNSIIREGVETGDKFNSIELDLKQYSKEIADMDEDDVDPVKRRLQDWAENPINKEIVSHRNSSVSIYDIVKEGKILLVRNTVASDEVKRVISTAMMRRVWAAIQSRSENTEKHEREPFFAYIDEFNDVATKDMNVKQMLSRARSGGLSVNLVTQNPSQIDELDDQGEILKQVFNEVRTMVSFSVINSDDAEMIADRLGSGFDKDDMTNMGQYRAVAQLSYQGEDGEDVTGPVDLRTFPEYPPLRSDEEVDNVIEHALDKHGVTPMENDPRQTELLVTGGGLGEETETSCLEALWGAHLQTAEDVVSLSEVVDRFNRVGDIPFSDFPKGVGIDEDYIEVANVDFESEGDAGGPDAETDAEKRSNPVYKEDDRIYLQVGNVSGEDPQITITAEGIEAVLGSDTGRSEPNPIHRRVIREGFRWFARMGYDCTVPTQSGENEVPDGNAELPISDDAHRKEIQQAVQEFQETYPKADELFSDDDITIEAETTTRRKPARTIENVIRGVKDRKHVALLVEDGRNDGYGRDYHAERVERILDDPPLYREDVDIPPGTEPDDADSASSVRMLYNRTDKLSIGDPDNDDKKFALIPKGHQSVWVDTGSKIELYDGRGAGAEKFGEVKYGEVFNASSNAMNIWCRYDPYQKEWVVYPGVQEETQRYDTKSELKQDYTFVRGPLYAPAKISETPTRDDWTILITPDPKAALNDPNERDGVQQDSDTEVEGLDVQFPPAEAPLIYEDGDTQPLIPEDNEALLTGDREDDQADETSSTGQDDAGDTADELTITEVEEKMGSLRQIKMEEKAKKRIDGFEKQHTEKEKQRLSEFDDVFGANNPGEIDTWQLVWDHFSREYHTGIPETYISKAVMAATGFTASKSEDAVEVGKEFGLLVKGTPANEAQLNEDVQQDDIYRLVLPAERPDLYTDDAKQFAERETWSECWTDVADTTQPLTETALTRLLIKSGIVADKTGAAAALSVGLESEAISYDESVGYRLSAERPSNVWLGVWESTETDIESPLPRDEILVNLRIELMDESVGADTYLDEAIARNELYTTNKLSDDEYLINDPGSDGGPEIESTPDDDSSDDDSDGDGDGDESGGNTEQSVDEESGDQSEDTSTSTDTDTTPSDDSGDDAPDTSPDSDSPEDITPTADDTADESPSDDGSDGGSDGIPTVETESASSGGVGVLIPDDKSDAGDGVDESGEGDSGDDTETSDTEEGQAATETSESTTSSDESDSDDTHVELDQDRLDEHYERIRPVYEALGAMNGYSTMLIHDFVGWYVTENNEDYDSALSPENNPNDPQAFPKKRRPKDAVSDLDGILNAVERSMYALTSYKSDESFTNWKVGRWNPDSEAFEYSTNGTPTAEWEDTRALMSWGDIDLADHLKPQRGDLDEATQTTAERALQAYVEGYAQLYGDKNAIFGLDSVGGAYIMGAPAATEPIVTYFRDVKDDEEAIGLVFEEFRDRTNERLKQIEEHVNETVEGAEDVIQPDWCNNVNRQYKAPLSVHKDLPGVVTPIDVFDVGYEFTHIDSVTDELVSTTEQWADDLTHTRHQECIEHLVSELWPEKYEEADGNWKRALTLWVDAERARVEEQKKKRQQAREEALEQTETEIEGEINLTKNYVELDDAVGAVSTERVVRRYACDGWDTGISHSHKTEFNPCWRHSASGSSCFVNSQADVFSDPGMGGGGHADKAMALADASINYDDPSEDLNGDKWGAAVQSLRDVGFDIPHYIPDVGSPMRHREGDYDQVPNWAMKKAALLFGVCEDKEAFVEKEDDEGNIYTHLKAKHYAETAEILQDEYGYQIDTEDHSSSDGDGDTAGSVSDSTDDDVADMSAVLGESVSDGGQPNGDESGEDALDQGIQTLDTPIDSDAIDNDIDTHVLTHFVDEHCRVNFDSDTKEATRTTTAMEAFIAWVEANNIGDALDDLSPDVYKDNRMSTLASTLESEYGIDKKKVRMDTETPRCFTPMVLSDDIRNLIESAE